jgi:hypothetical protein
MCGRLRRRLDRAACPEAGRARGRRGRGAADARDDRLAGAVRARPATARRAGPRDRSAGGVGHIAVQLAGWAGADVVADCPADLVFDTTGTVRPDGAARYVTIVDKTDDGIYFVVEPHGDQLAEAARVGLRPQVDSVFRPSRWRPHSIGSRRGAKLARSYCVSTTAESAARRGQRPVGFAAWLDLATRYGQLDDGLDASEGPGPADEQVEVRATTGFGDITIRREAQRSDEPLSRGRDHE